MCSHSASLFDAELSGTFRRYFWTFTAEIYNDMIVVFSSFLVLDNNVILSIQLSNACLSDA